MKKALEDLIFLGYHDKEIKLFNKVWKLRILNGTENYETISLIEGLPDSLAKTLKYKMAVLARAIKEVNGVIIESTEEGTEFVNNLSITVLNKLFDKYTEFVQEENDLLTDDEELKK